MAKSYIVAILHAAAILALISVPGLWWNSWQTMRRRLQAAFVVLPGILGIAALGLIYWRLGPSASPAYGYGWVAVIGVLFIDLMRHAIVTKFWRRRQHGFEDRGQIAIIVWLTLFVQTFAFGVNPLPVAQEFRAGSIIPGRMVASPPDNDIPYRTAVYFFYGKHGHKDSAIYFGDWSIASRGPLVPFAINSLFHIFGGHPSDPPSYKRNPWPRGEPGADLARSFGWLMNAMVVLGAFDLMRALGVSFRRRYVALAPVALINTAFSLAKAFRHLLHHVLCRKCSSWLLHISWGAYFTCMAEPPRGGLVGTCDRYNGVAVNLLRKRHNWIESRDHGWRLTEIRPLRVPVYTPVGVHFLRVRHDAYLLGF
jgi:hypothetical protein